MVRSKGRYSSVVNQTVQKTGVYPLVRYEGIETMTQHLKNLYLLMLKYQGRVISCVREEGYYRVQVMEQTDEIWHIILWDKD